MHGYFHDRRSDTADAITVEEGRVVMRNGREPLEMDFHDQCCSSYFWIGSIFYNSCKRSEIVKYSVIEITKL